MPLSLPPHVYETRASWVDLPAGCADALAEAGLGEQLEAGLHAAAHALLAVLPLHLSCEPGDVGCECNALRKASQLRRGGPQRLLLFDRCTCMLRARCVHGVRMVALCYTVALCCFSTGARAASASPRGFMAGWRRCCVPRSRWPQPARVATAAGAAPTPSHPTLCMRGRNPMYP